MKRTNDGEANEDLKKVWKVLSLSTHTSRPNTYINNGSNRKGKLGFKSVTYIRSRRQLAAATQSISSLCCHLLARGATFCLCTLSDSTILHLHPVHPSIPWSDLRICYSRQSCQSSGSCQIQWSWARSGRDKANEWWLQEAWILCQIPNG